MASDIREPLNLKGKNSQLTGQGFGALKPSPSSSQNKKDLPKPSAKNDLTLEKIYQEHGGSAQEMRKLAKPQPGSRFSFNFKLDGKKKKILIIAAITVIVLLGLIWLVDNYQSNKSKDVKEVGWYAVKLINGEIFYGQIGNTASDPIVMEKVYYNYDQLKDKAKEANTSGNLRLVKRGKEAFGPSGTMNIVRSQIVYMEPMKETSKVLQAILEYEK